MGGMGMGMRGQGHQVQTSMMPPQRGYTPSFSEGGNTRSRRGRRPPSGMLRQLKQEEDILDEHANKLFNLGGNEDNFGSGSAGVHGMVHYKAPKYPQPGQRKVHRSYRKNENVNNLYQGYKPESEK